MGDWDDARKITTDKCVENAIAELERCLYWHFGVDQAARKIERIKAIVYD